MKYSLTCHHLCQAILLLGLCMATPTVAQDADSRSTRDVFLLPCFLGNGETGIYFAYSLDGLKFK